MTTPFHFYQIPTGAVELATRLIQHVEGCRLHAYLDSGGVPTIGIGCTRLNGQPVTMRTAPITEQQALDALEFELGQTEKLLTSVIRTHLTPGEWAACASLAYNIGGPRFSGSTLLKYINAIHMDEAELEFAKWNIVHGKVDKGLVNRRSIERIVFASGKIPDGPPVAPTICYVTVPTTASEADDLNAMQLVAIQARQS